MALIYPLVRAVRRYAVRASNRYWVNLEEDYKSVVCALLIVAFIVAFDPGIPW